MTTRVMPPGDGSFNPIRANGRSYSCPVGQAIDVPDHDAAILIANGWQAGVPGATVGTTAQRPVNPPNGTTFIDTTTGAALRFDVKSKSWLHHITGAVS